MELFHRQAGEGKPVIILHGLFGTSDNWQIIAKKMAETHQVFTVDLRNHGQTFHSDEFGYGLMAEDIEEFIDTHSIEKPVIIGHSMGGKVAMRSALLFPEKITSIISVDMAPKYYPVRHERIIDALTNARIADAASRKEIDEQLAVKIPNFGERQFLMKNLKRKQEGGFEWKMNLPIISSKIENLGEAIHGDEIIHVPALFIRGSNSDYILDSDFPEIQKTFPESEFVTIEDAGHWVHADKPQELLDAFYDFF